MNEEHKSHWYYVGHVVREIRQDRSAHRAYHRGVIKAIRLFMRGPHATQGNNVHVPLRLK